MMHLKLLNSRLNYSKSTCIGAICMKQSWDNLIITATRKKKVYAYQNVNCIIILSLIILFDEIDRPINYPCTRLDILKVKGQQNR